MDVSLNTEVYGKPTHIQTSSYSLTATTLWNTNLGLSGPCNTGQKTLPLSPKETKRNTHLKKTLTTCRNFNWAFIKSVMIHSKGQTTTSKKQSDKQNNVVIPYASGSSEKLR